MGDGKLVFHAPYIKENTGIRCVDKNTANDLNYYYAEMIAPNYALRLFDRTMSYCSVSKGWSLDAGAAQIYGLLTN